MTTTFGDEMRAEALALVQEFGGAMTATFEVEGGSYDPTTGAVSSSITNVQVAVAPLLAYRAQDVDGTTIQARDAQLLVPYSANVSFTPTVGQRVTVSGQKWSVLHVDRIDPDDTPALWRLQLRPA